MDCVQNASFGTASTWHDVAKPCVLRYPVRFERFACTKRRLLETSFASMTYLRRLRLEVAGRRKERAMFKAMRKRTFRPADASTQLGCVLPKVFAVVAILERINIGFEACIEGVASVLRIERWPEPSLQGTTNRCTSSRTSTHRPST